MERQCVFWIPTIYHQKIEPLKDYRAIEKEDISDKVGHPCRLTLKLFEEGHIYVELFYGEEKEEESFGFTLTKEENHRNGFFAYKYDVPDTKFEIIRTALTNPIYHYVKGFYHKHEYHSPDCDSILNAYVPEETAKIELNCPDNRPLVFYLKQYEKRFKDFAEQLDYDAKELLEETKNPDNTAILIQEKYEAFNQRCMDILGEVTYYHSLFYSKHNRSYKLPSEVFLSQESNYALFCPDKVELQDLYKSALNTENAISHIQLIAKKLESVYRWKQTNSTLANIKENKSIIEQIKSLSIDSLALQAGVNQSLKQGDRLSKIGLGLGILGGILGIISIYLSFKFSSPDYTLPINQTIRNTEMLNRKIDSLEEKLSSMPPFLMDTISKSVQDNTPNQSL